MLNEISQFVSITETKRNMSYFPFGIKHCDLQKGIAKKRTPAVRVSISLRIPFLEKYFSSTLQVK